MTAPDVPHLFERFLQIYGGQGVQTEPTGSEPGYRSSQPTYSAPADAYGSDDGSAPSGGVLRGWNSLPLGAPLWVQAVAGLGGMPAGLRGPSVGGRIGGLPFSPMPSRPEDVVEIPNPHLERGIPQSTRDFWNAMALTQQMFRGQWLGDGPSSESTEGETNRRSEPEANRPGSQPPWYVGPPVLEEERKRRSVSNEREQRTAQEPDPEFRKLMRIESSKDHGAEVLQQASSQKIGRVNSPRLAPELEELDDSLGKDVSSGGGNCGNGKDDDGGEPDKNAYCDARQDIEIERCDVRSQKRPQWPNMIACVKRANTRRDQCHRNGGMPPLYEREEWGIDDEHQIKSDKRFMQRQERRGGASKKSRKWRK